MHAYMRAHLTGGDGDIVNFHLPAPVERVVRGTLVWGFEAAYERALEVLACIARVRIAAAQRWELNTLIAVDALCGVVLVCDLTKACCALASARHGNIDSSILVHIGAFWS